MVYITMVNAILKVFKKRVLTNRIQCLARHNLLWLTNYKPYFLLSPILI